MNFAQPKQNSTLLKRGQTAPLGPIPPSGEHFLKNIEVEAGKSGQEQVENSVNSPNALSDTKWPVVGDSGIKLPVKIESELEEPEKELITTPCIQGGLRKVYKSYIAYILDYTINVPMGFFYDGASIPRFLWVFFGTPFQSCHDVPSCIHDYLYRKDCTPDVDRKEADVIFYELLRGNGVSYFKALLMYYGVRMFGWYSWRKKPVQNS